VSRYSSVILLLVIISAGGLVSIGIGLLAQARLNPNAVEWDRVRYEVVVVDYAESRSFTLVHEGREVASLTGSTDRLCDIPYTMWLDVDDDGVKDLYFHECGGHGYLSGHGGTISFINLGQWDPEDAPAVNGWWSTAIQTGGVIWIVTGSIAVLLGLLGILSSAPISRGRRTHALRGTVKGRERFL